MFEFVPNPLDPSKFDAVLKSFTKKIYRFDPVRFEDRYMDYNESKELMFDEECQRYVTPKEIEFLSLNLEEVRKRIMEK